MTVLELIQVLTGFLGSLGFSLLFNIRGRKLLIASVGGLISWSVFLLLMPLFPGEAMRYFFAATAITVYAEIFARIEKTPTTTFLVPAVIPLVPGGSLYYTMNDALNKQWGDFAHRAFYTVQLALSLAVGIIAVTTLTRILMALVRTLQNKKVFSHFH